MPGAKQAPPFQIKEEESSLMQYRTFGRLDWKVSALGFGAMRLPRIDDDPGQIDEPEATRMIRYAIDQGVNYVDTAYPYHRETSETFLGRALQDGYREQIKLATKMPCWKVEAPEDFDRLLNEQLEKLQTDHIDFYLLHALNAKSWPKVRDLDVLQWAEGALADGRIGHLGFSFHDQYEVFQEIVDATDLWAFCQIMYNYMDIEHQAGMKGLQYAAARGLALVIMEPIRGGRLSNHVPATVEAIWDNAPVKRTPADWALQWVWNHPEVAVVLSGMSTMDHVTENIDSARRSGPGTLTADDLALYDRVREAYQALSVIPCTDCRYCLPCPSGVNIPRVFEIYNDLMMYGDENRAQMVYEAFMKADERADQCIECGECLEKCPQDIEIPDWLAKAHEALCKKEES
jgi:predicted aldo/keto reductase-like oxidoreductase